jgi:hypothetical protein
MCVLDDEGVYKIAVRRIAFERQRQPAAPSPIDNIDIAVVMH